MSGYHRHTDKPIDKSARDAFEVQSELPDPDSPTGFSSSIRHKEDRPNDGARTYESPVLNPFDFEYDLNPVIFPRTFNSDNLGEVSSRGHLGSGTVDTTGQSIYDHYSAQNYRKTTVPTQQGQRNTYLPVPWVDLGYQRSTDPAQHSLRRDHPHSNDVLASSELNGTALRAPTELPSVTTLSSGSQLHRGSLSGDEQENGSTIFVKPPLVSNDPAEPGNDTQRMKIENYSYRRPSHPKLLCDKCDITPQGFGGEHELKRHHDRDHATRQLMWICTDPETNIKEGWRPERRLSSCKQCMAGKQYNVYYNAVAHLRRAHFSPRKRGSKNSAAIGRGDWPPVAWLKTAGFLTEIEINPELTDDWVGEDGGDQFGSADEQSLDVASMPPVDPIGMNTLPGHVASEFSPRSMSMMQSTKPASTNGNEQASDKQCDRPAIQDTYGELCHSADPATERMTVQSPEETTDEISLPDKRAGTIYDNGKTLQEVLDFGAAQSCAGVTFSTTDEGYHSMDMPDALPTDTVNYDDDHDDTRSIMTDGRTSDLPCESKAHLAALFATEMFEDLGLDEKLSTYNTDDVLPSMPELLKDYSLLIGSRATSSIQERAATFVRHSRQRIYYHVKEQMRSAVARTQLPGGDTLSAKAKFAMWNIDPEAYEDDAALDNTETVEGDQDIEDSPQYDISDIPNGPEAKSFLLESDEYKWLLGSVRKNLNNTPSEQISKIRQAFLSNLPQRQRHSNDRLELSLALDWTPQWMMSDCLGSDTGRSGLNSVITITGGISNAYATTCEEYMKTMWPIFGLDLLECARQAGVSDDGRAELCTSDTSFNLACQHDTTILRAHGTSVNLIELFEAMVWLATACRQSPLASNFAICEPTITRRDTEDLMFKVGFSFSTFEPGELNNEAATCWHNMFRNPVIAKGFSTPRRHHGERGLELTLEMLAILGQTFWATCFDGFLLKGFNSITSAVRRVKDSVLWHFSVNKDGSRMRYGDSGHIRSTMASGDVVFPGVRHFVGWSDRVQIVAGTRYANYDDIEESNSNKASSGIGVDTTLAVNGGYFINVGCKIRRGCKDAPECLRMNFYERQIDTTTRWAVILVDTTDRRHWLLDGATAILHLCRAWLSPEQVRYAPPGKAERIIQPEQSASPDASYKTLLHDSNRKLQLRASTEIKTKRVFNGMNDMTKSTEITETWWCLEHLAGQMYHILEQMRARVTKGTPSTIELQLKTRTLTGFELKDLLLDEGLIEPRSIDLQTGASDWLDFSLNTNTINIFGSNFGELVRQEPTGPRADRLCGSSGSVIIGYDHLAAPLSILEAVTGGHRKHSNTALHLAENIYLRNPESYFQACECGRAPSPRCSTLVTSFCKSPSRYAKFKSKHPIFEDFRNGAFVFGHQDGRLIKGNPRKRKAEATQREQPKIPRNSSDSGIDVGSSRGSNSPNSADVIDGASSSSGYSFLGAALRRGRDNK